MIPVDAGSEEEPHQKLRCQAARAELGLPSHREPIKLRQREVNRFNLEARTVAEERNTVSTTGFHGRSHTQGVASLSSCFNYQCHINSHTEYIHFIQRINYWLFV